MRISNLGLMALRGSGRETKQKLADALGVTENSIYQWIAENNDNLTKAAALKVIQEVTGLTNEQILEESTLKTA